MSNRRKLHQPVVVIRAADVAKVNAALERHGFGPGTFSEPVAGKSAGKTAKPTHYALEMPCDDGEKAAIELVIKELKLTGATVRHQFREMRRDPATGRRRPTQSKLDEVLAKANLKRKNARVTADLNRRR